MARLLLLFLLLAIPACDAWKRADAEVGLLLVPHVRPVVIEGRSLIRIRNKKAVVFIDAVGGKIIDYRPWHSDADDLKVDSHFTWQPQTIPARPELGAERFWQVGSPEDSDAQLALLSETSGSLRWRIEYELLDTGDLNLNIRLDNTAFQSVTIGIQSPDVPGSIIRSTTCAPEGFAGNRLESATLPGQGFIAWSERWSLQPH